MAVPATNGSVGEKDGGHQVGKILDRRVESGNVGQSGQQSIGKRMEFVKSEKAWIVEWGAGTSANPEKKMRRMQWRSVGFAEPRLRLQSPN